MNEQPAAFPETLDIKQASQLLRLGYDATKSLVDDGTLPAVVLNQKHTVMLRDDLLAWVRDEGRRQQQARKDAAKPKREPTAAQSTGRRQARPRKAVPDLAMYELTKGARPESTRVN